jgi:hypothetical protein
VLLSAATRRLVGELFQYRETTLSAFNDDAKPVAIWQVIGEGTARSRFEALHGFEVSDLGPAWKLKNQADRKNAGMESGIS